MSCARRVGWWTAVAAAVSIYALSALSGCMSFQMSAAEAQATLSDSPSPVVHGARRLGDRTLHFVDSGNDGKPPVIVIHGERDRLVPVGNAAFVERRLTGAPQEVARVPDLDHFVPWTRPELIEDAVLDRLDRNAHPANRDCCGLEHQPKTPDPGDDSHTGP